MYPKCHDLGVAERAAELYAAQIHDYCVGGIPVDRILSMLAGEALRLEAYAADGLIDPDEPVPHDILYAAHALQASGHNQRAFI